MASRIFFLESLGQFETIDSSRGNFAGFACMLCQIIE